MLALTPAGAKAFAAERAFHRHLIDDALEPLDAESRTHVRAALAGKAQTGAQ